VDPDAQTNPFVDEFHRITGDTWPIDDDTVDLIVIDNVLEHVREPERVFAEIRRVLKLGGFLCIRTPNRWSYIALAATLIPNSLHAKVTSLVQQGRKSNDVFPTLYRCNSLRQLNRLMSRHGFDQRAVYGYEAEPSYLAFSRFAYTLGVLHQRFAPRFLRPALFAFGRLAGS
jgi:SAM-dependent methyltransferase